MLLRVPPTSLRWERWLEQELFDVMSLNDDIGRIYHQCTRSGVVVTVCHDLVVGELLMVMMAIYLRIPLIEVWHVPTTNNSPV